MLDRAQWRDTALCVNSKISERGDGAVGVDELEELRERAASVSVRRQILQNSADVAVLEQQPAHHLHAAEHRQIVDARHQAAGFGMRR